MSQRKAQNIGALALFGRLVVSGMKALMAPVFSAFGGSGYGTNGGLYGSSAFAPWQPGAKRDYRADAGDLWRNSAVASCLAWYGDNSPIPKKRVVRRDKETGELVPVPDHPLIRVLDRPNPYYNWHDLLKALTLSYRCDGNGFLLISKPIGHLPGEPVNLWWIDHRRIWPRWSTTGDQYLGWWDYQVDGRIIRLEVDQVIHFRDGVDPHNDRLGLCALKSTLREVCSDNQGASYTSAIMRNMGVVGYAISPLSPQDNFGHKDERDEIADSFVEANGGENSGRPLVASLGMKIDRLGMTPEELALDKIMKIPESRICAAMRLSAMVVGLAVGAEQRTFSNYEEARKAAYEDGLIPLQTAFAATINQVLMPLLGEPGDVFEFDYDSISFMRENQDAKFDRYGKAYQVYRVITLNMALKALGYAPVAGGDKFADGSLPADGPSVPAKPPALAIAPPGDQQDDEGDQEDEDEVEAAKALMARVEAVLARAEEITVSTKGAAA